MKSATLDRKTEYKVSNLANAFTTISNASGDSVKFFLDDGGNIVGITTTNEEDALNDQIVYVTKIGNFGTGFTGDWRAEVVTKKGEVLTVNIDASYTDKLFYKLTKDGEKYKMTAATTVGTVTSTAIDPTSSNALSGDTSRFADTKTVFIVKSTDSAKKVTYKAYTGGTNAPEFTSTNKATVQYVYGSNNIITYVFIANGEDAKDATPDGTKMVVAFLSNSIGTESKNGDIPAHTFYDAIVDGIKTKVKVLGSPDINIADPIKRVFEVIEDADGFLTIGTAVSALDAGDFAQTSGTATAGLLEVNSLVKTYVVDDEILYTIASGEFTASTITTTTNFGSGTDNYYVVYVKSGNTTTSEIEAIYRY